MRILHDRIRDACLVIGLSEREYCDRFISQMFGPSRGVSETYMADFLSALQNQAFILAGQ